MIDIGERLRQTGADIGNAISGPAELRYKIAEMKKKEEAEIASAEQKASDRTFDRDYKQKTLDVQQYNAETNRAKALRDKPQKVTGPDRYLQTFNGLQIIDEQLTQATAGLSQKVMDAHSSGDPEAAAKAMNDFNQFTDVIEKKVKTELASVGDYLEKNSYAKQVADNVTTHLSKLTPRDIQETENAVFQTLPKQLGVSQSKIDSIREAGAKYNAGDPFEGVPSLSEIQNKALQASLKKDLNVDELNLILGGKAKSVEEYKNQLKEIVSGKDFTPIQKDLAVDILTNLSAMDTLGLDKNSILSEASQYKLKVVGKKK